ncbi:glycosyltransferase family 2 protein [Photobacterium leiognathi]|uniref:glycosyltransferase family 2 protein n=1 Tax=Photobacterium leiognathi TaxID=553611 RepID=UPI002980B569|nr:glycosyltransferase family 2 protein [Photobacterium leiognathi]
MFKPKISIIVTIYNLEKHIEACINSIFQQTYSNIEIICVNDGSTDKSKSILDRLSDMDTRIHCSHIKNSGVTKARAKGFELSTSEYIMFVDGDDTLPSDAIECLLSNLIKHDTDISIGGYSAIYNEKDKKSYRYNNEIISPNKLANKMILGEIMGSPCMRLYKRNLFDEASFIFTRDIIRGEDLLMNLTLLNKASSISITDRLVYNYYIRTTSTMGKFRCSLKYETEFRALIRDIYHNNAYNDPESQKSLNLSDLNAYLYAMYSNIVNDNLSENVIIISHLKKHPELIKVRRKLNFKFKVFFLLFGLNHLNQKILNLLIRLIK